MDERLERVLRRVQSGESILEAINAEGITNVYYRRFTAKERAPIVAAKLAYETQQKADEEALSTNFLVYMSSERKQAFQAICQADGTTMSRCVNSLVSAFMQTKRDV